jgi:hypothetical protein
MQHKDGVNCNLIIFGFMATLVNGYRKTLSFPERPTLILFKFLIKLILFFLNLIHVNPIVD